MIGSLLNWIKDRWYFFTTFFPVQLFLLHLRRSHLLIIFWLLLFAFTGGYIAQHYGLQYLFLTPEYLDHVGFLSYFFVGLTLGLFIMAFHISSYIYYSYRYSFLATTSRPLWVFSINNSLIPTLFLLFYIYHIIVFLHRDNYNISDIVYSVSGLLAGTALMVSLTFSYFIKTIQTLELPDEKTGETKPLRPFKNLIKADTRFVRIKSSGINYYLKGPFSIKLARGTDHYKSHVLLETIQQHHFSASLYFVALILLVITLSLVSTNTYFIIPAGASIFLLFSLYLMITGAFYTRLKTWTVTVGVLVLVLLNYFSGFEQFQTYNYAFGMNYDVERAPYNYENFRKLTTDSIVSYDRDEGLQALENWKAKNSKDGKKPKLVIFNVSGGGLRSALWAIEVMQQLDKVSKGQLYNNTHLITGSSGGMLGAAFYREMKYSYDTKKIKYNPNGDTIKTLVAKDLLNPVTFTFGVNDLFFRFRNISFDGKSYPLDRGYAFDNRLNDNTLGLMNKKFKDYREPEYNADMPRMILGPTIVGDGRKMLMSTLGTSFLTFTSTDKGHGVEKQFNAVEFSRLFKDQEAENLSFLTAIRLSASFPFITPLVNMPSTPGIQLIDAGVRDNEGYELAIRFLFYYREWIKENTDGVVIIQMKANRPEEIPIRQKSVTKFDKLTLPLSGVLESFHNLQIYNKGLLMELSHQELGLPIDMVRFSLLKDKEDVSLSWHLTNSEKEEIIKTFNNQSNQEALQRLKELMQFP